MGLMSNSIMLEFQPWIC